MTTFSGMGDEKGVILEWSPERGCGFIMSERRKDRVFIRIEAFGDVRKRGQPGVGDRVLLHSADDVSPRATHVVRERRAAPTEIECERCRTVVAVKSAASLKVRGKARDVVVCRNCGRAAVFDGEVVRKAIGKEKETLVNGNANVRAIREKIREKTEEKDHLSKTMALLSPRAVAKEMVPSWGRERDKSRTKGKKR